MLNPSAIYSIQVYQKTRGEFENLCSVFTPSVVSTVKPIKSWIKAYHENNVACKHLVLEYCRIFLPYILYINSLSHFQICVVFCHWVIYQYIKHNSSKISLTVLNVTDTYWINKEDSINCCFFVLFMRKNITSTLNLMPCASQDVSNCWLHVRIIEIKSNSFMVTLNEHSY